MKITSEAKLLIAMAAIVLAGGGYLVFGSKLGLDDAPPAAPTPAPRTVSRAEFEKMMDGAPVKGNPTARYTVLEFADFQCPTCRAAYEGVVRHFGTSIDVRFAFRHYPIEEMHAWAIPAALAVDAARAQNKFWEMYSELFHEAKPVWSEEYIRNIAKKVGLEMKAYDAFVSDPKHTTDILSQRDRAAAVGIYSTPTFWVLDNQTGEVKTPIALEIYKVLADVPGMPTPPPAAAKK